MCMSRGVRLLLFCIQRYMPRCMLMVVCLFVWMCECVCVCVCMGVSTRAFVCVCVCVREKISLTEDDKQY